MTGAPMVALVLSLPALGAGMARAAGGGEAGAGDAALPFYAMASEADIDRALREMRKAHPALPDRIAAVSARFLGTPYRLGPLGEGPWGRFDRDPLINFREVDCTTLVEETMALSLEYKLSRAIRTLQNIRYKDGKIAYESRNHFPIADWIPNNVASGYLRDVTREIGGGETRTASKLIRKRQWYASKTLKDLDGFDQVPKKERLDRLKALRALAGQMEDRRYSIDYVPISLLPKIADKIPSGTIVNLVREDAPRMPTLVSHQALIIDKNGAKFVRHASPGRGVEDVPLSEYFYRYFDAPWRLVGLNFNEVRDPYAKR